VTDRGHLSIGEVLSLVQEDFPDVTISKIRFLESQGLLDPERTPSGYRKFYDGDIERLQWILTQQRDNFLPLKVIRERLDEWDATGTPPGGDAQTPPVHALPGGLGADGKEAGEADPRHAAADLAASSAVEVMARPDEHTDADGANADRDADDESEPEPAPAAAMEAAPRVDEPAPAPAPVNGDGPGPDAEFRVGPRANSLTADELAQRVGVPVSVIDELASYSMIEAKRIGPESYFEPASVEVALACRRFLDHGIEVRHLRMYKIAAEREAGIFEQLVMPLLKQRNPDARAKAVDTVRSLAETGEALHAALLRNALSDTLP
jgi:DNA-binding transcriptional MerR regulator